MRGVSDPSLYSDHGALPAGNKDGIRSILTASANNQSQLHTSTSNVRGIAQKRGPNNSTIHVLHSEDEAVNTIRLLAHQNLRPRALFRVVGSWSRLKNFQRDPCPALLSGPVPRYSRFKIHAGISLMTDKQDRKPKQLYRVRVARLHIQPMELHARSVSLLSKRGNSPWGIGRNRCYS
eukprot:757166-Pleurochrysis_carterae.AAC.1